MIARTIREAALQYAGGHEWRVLRLKSRGKAPDIGMDWPNKASSDGTQIRNWFPAETDANVGLLLGPLSDVIDVEADDAAGEAEYARLVGEDSPITPTYSSGRGKHRLFRWTSELPNEKAVIKLGPGGTLEIRTGNGGKGAQSVLPPSVHPSGTQYAWLPGLSPDDVPLAELPAGIVAAVSVASVEGAPPDRAWNYIDKIPRSIEGQRGSDRLFEAACQLRRKIGLTAEESLPLLLRWNAGCLPPWSEAEIRRKISEAEKKVPPQPAGGDGLPVDVAENRTDLANAKRLVNRFGAELRFVPTWSHWLAWDGRRWVKDDGNVEVMRRAKQVAESLWAEAGKHLGVSAVIAYAKASASQRGLVAMIKVAESDLAVSHDGLDSHTWLITCLNGTIDLQTGTLRPHDPADLITKLVPVSFRPEANCLRWERFVNEVLPGLGDFMQRLAGYALTGDVSEQVLPILWGSGSNGKTTLLTTLQHVFGDYGGQAPSTLLAKKSNDQHPTEIAGLCGKRLVVSSETEGNCRLAEGLVKQLTGGDTIVARRMREDYWEFKPTHTLFLATNHKPSIRGTDHGLWRRLQLIPFTQRFDGQNRERGLDAKLAAEAEGVFAWIVRGCLEWQRIGLLPPEAVRAATTDYRESEDVIGRFVEECCEKADGVSVGFRVLYARLRVWTESAGEEVPAQRVLSAWLKDNGFVSFRNNGKHYRGLRTGVGQRGIVA